MTPCDIYSATVSGRWLSHDGFICVVVVSFAKDQLGVLVFFLLLKLVCSLVLL